MKRRIILTFGEIKEKGVWSEVCKREQWDEEFWEGKLSNDMRFHIDADLIETKDTNC
jgi:hypothetical protein